MLAHLGNDPFVDVIVDVCKALVCHHRTVTVPGLMVTATNSTGQ